MPAPLVQTYSVAAKVAAHQAFANLVDSGAGSGNILIRDAGDVLLARVPLNDPCGTVSGVTGQLALSVAGPDASADATGIAAYAEICNSDDLSYLALPVQSGTVAVPGVVVLNTLSIVATGPVYAIAPTIG